MLSPAVLDICRGRHSIACEGLHGVSTIPPPSGWCICAPLLRSAHKRIVNIMTVYIERNNIQVELLRFRKKIATLFALQTLTWETFATDVFVKLGSLLSVTCRHRSVQCRGRTCARKAWGRGSRAFVYLLFQLTKNADSYGIVL